MKGNDWVLLAVVGIGGYLLYNYFTNGSTSGSGGFNGGGGGSNGNGNVTPPPSDTTPNNPIGGIKTGVIPGYGKIPFVSNPADMTPKEVKQQEQAWAGGAYGAQGQPSVTFLQNTVSQGENLIAYTAKNIPGSGLTIAGKRIVAAAQAVGSAPPRVVAKIKAGRVY